MRFRTWAIALMFVASSCDEKKAEHLPAGGPKTLFSDYAASVRQHFPILKVGHFSDSHNELLLTAPNGKCAAWKHDFQPGGGTEIPDGVAVMCRDGDSIVWELDRR